jgi:hypothetical protein
MARSRGLGDVYKRQAPKAPAAGSMGSGSFNSAPPDIDNLLTKYGGR